MLRQWGACGSAFLGKPLPAQAFLYFTRCLTSYGETTSSSETEATPKTTPTPSSPSPPPDSTTQRLPSPDPAPGEKPSIKERPVNKSRRHGLEKLRKLMGRHSGGPVVLLGIESSCDDTGVAVVDERGRVLGEGLHSQTKDHQKTGGIVPQRASELHRDHLERITTEALEKSGRSLEEVAGIAVTVAPGLHLCLREGINYAQKLAIEAKKPLLPIHHMAAHALMPRLDKYIAFPYLVLLCSGGHCLLAIVHSNSNFTTLGRCLDDSPGEAFDKCARMMRLDLHPDLQDVGSGGAAVERLAKKGNPQAVQLMKGGMIMGSSLCCNFSFAGIKQAVKGFVDGVASQGWDGESPLPMCEDVAAVFQRKLVDHMVVRTHRAILYLIKHHFKFSTLVASGGVACNAHLRSKLEHLASYYHLQFHAPPPHLCTDNGTMIAWAGMERLMANEGTESGAWPGQGEKGPGMPWGVCWTDLEKEMLITVPKLGLGRDVSDKVKAERIKVKVEYWKDAQRNRNYHRYKRWLAEQRREKQLQQQTTTTTITSSTTSSSSSNGPVDSQ